MRLHAPVNERKSTRFNISLWSDYCIEGGKGTEKKRYASSPGANRVENISGDAVWAFRVPKFSINRKQWPNLTVAYEKPVLFVGVDLQLASKEDAVVMYAVSIQTEEGGEFETYVVRPVSSCLSD